ncbi:hypothetical protein ERJ75_001697800 [Trypanosoma vivax]|nr:hypothetical protein ERJ75_001697800 [Trypanosoma vivax]
MHLLVAVAAFALLTSSASAADNKGLQFDDAKAACEVATVLEAMAVAATMAAEEAATIGGAARAWGRPLRRSRRQPVTRPCSTTCPRHGR